MAEPINSTNDTSRLQELVYILLLILLAFAFFAVTHTYSDAYNARRGELGKQWFARGLADLQAGRADAAVEEIRTALLYAPDSWDYRLRFGEALTAADRVNAALENYKSLWQIDPNNGSVNLLLARLAARIGNQNDAKRYFNGAIFGIWKEGAAGNRREALFELIQFYLQHNDNEAADSQLLVLSDNLADDPNLHAQVGTLFLSVNDIGHARQQFLNALSHSPQNVAALRGEAEVDFRSGEYNSARSLLERLLRIERDDSVMEQRLETVKNILTLDPSLPRIASSERADRVLHDFALANDRLTSCGEKLQAAGSAQPASLADLSLRSMNMTPLELRKLRSDADLMDQATDVIYDVEKETSSVCGDPPPGPDFALLILARRRTNSGQ